MKVYCFDWTEFHYEQIRARNEREAIKLFNRKHSITEDTPEIIPINDMDKFDIDRLECDENGYLKEPIETIDNWGR